MKYIFIDIDGVLNTKSSWNIRYSIKRECVDNLAEIAIFTNARIVLVSTWKPGFEKEYDKCFPEIQKIRDILRDKCTDIYDKCPTLKGRTRNKEIERYRYFNDIEEDYVILDDDISLYEADSEEKGHVYQVNCETGLTKKDVDKISKIKPQV